MFSMTKTTGRVKTNKQQLLLALYVQALKEGFELKHTAADGYGKV